MSQKKAGKRKQRNEGENFKKETNRKQLYQISKYINNSIKRKGS